MREPHHEPTPPRPRWVALGGLTVGASAVSILLFTQNYLLFHSLLEMFGVAVGASVAMIAWNTRAIRRDDYMLLLGISFGAVAFMGVVHTLSHEGMNVFFESPDEASTHLALLSRIWLAGALLTAPLFIGRRMQVGPLMAATVLGCVLLTGMPLHTEWIPQCYLATGGPTLFTRGAETAIIALLLGAHITHWRAREGLHGDQLLILGGAISAAIMASACFATQVHPSDPISAAGHVCMLLSYIMVYWALVHIGLSQPFTTMFRDLVRSVAELEQAANKDTLTGLYNRRGMLALGDAQLALARRLGLTITVVFADLNGLKALNDEHGHAWGDRALEDTADLLRDTFRQADLLARVGGDEFMAMMIHGSGRSPISRLRAGLERHNRTQKRPYTLSIALGASLVAAGTAITLEEVLEEADAKMYTDKQRHYAALGLVPRSR